MNSQNRCIQISSPFHKMCCNSILPYPHRRWRCKERRASRWRGVFSLGFQVISPISLSNNHYPSSSGPYIKGTETTFLFHSDLCFGFPFLPLRFFNLQKSPAAVAIGEVPDDPEIPIRRNAADEDEDFC